MHLIICSVFIITDNTMYVAATVGFTQEIYDGSEAVGIIQVGIELIGGTVGAPVEITVTSSEQSPPSAQGNQLLYIIALMY